MEEQLKKEADKFNKDEKTAVIDGKSKQILDLDDILNGTSDVASRLRNLKKFGVTNEQIGQFLEVFGNVARQDEEGDVLLELEKVFNLFVDKISQAPNGVVINPNTGKEIWPDRTRVWSYTKDRHEENVANNLVYWGDYSSRRCWYPSRRY